MEKEILRLRDMALLKNLSDRTLDRIADVAVYRSYAPGEVILLEDEPCRAVYFIVEGHVRVYRTSPGGREQVLTRLGTGHAFNVVPAFRPHSVNRAHVQAITRVTLYVVSLDAFRGLIAECPDLALAVLQEFAERLDHLTELVGDLSLCSVRGRLVRFLLEHADRNEITRRWTQEEIASHLGTVRDMVGRTLRTLADDGLIRMDRQRIVLLDRIGLEKEAEG